MKLALDLNAYFASCEQQERPELRGLPIAVAPLMAETTCCIAASYAAKKFGVKTGTQVAEARRLCPGIEIVEARPPLYVHYHDRIKACVDRVVPIEAATSIDEFICDLPAGHKTPEKAVALAKTLKQAMAREVGEVMTCSIGIAPNAWLAKVASDIQKPDGLVLIEPHDLPHILHGLELRDLSGIGPNMEQRLNRARIFTVQQLCAASKLELRRAWGGVEGEIMFERLRGAPVPLTVSECASIGHSHVLPPVKRNDVDAHSIIHRMMQKAAMRLRRLDLVTSHMQVAVRFIGKQGRGHWDVDARFNHTDDTIELTHHLNALWADYPGCNTSQAPMHVGVVLSGLIESRHQTVPLFEAGRPHAPLMKAMDKLNLRFGKSTLYFGAAHKGRDHAPMRIAFTRIPDVEVE
ncbi:MAG: DUF4113 domain-containing protein [Stagnimonas sp.]|nr:DUF4113 domain-containing protein [Stagnimonas sp.]